MSGSWKYLFMLLASVFALYFGVKILVGLISGLLSLLVPVLILGAVAYVLYAMIGRKALGGGSRRPLP